MKAGFFAASATSVIVKKPFFLHCGNAANLEQQASK
jgi:hypothetical protein